MQGSQSRGKGLTAGSDRETHFGRTASGRAGGPLAANHSLAASGKLGLTDWAGEDARGEMCPANGSDAKLHGQGRRAEARAARGAPHVRRANARRVTPRCFDSNEPARPAGRSRAVPASAAS